MENYGEIMARIAELIQNGKNARDNNGEKVVSVRGYYVLESDVPEFCELLVSEKTFFLLNTEENPTLKNDYLLKLCQERASKIGTFPNDYVTLIEILNNAYGRQASELSEHSGYFFPKENIVEFHNLCQKLKVGPFTVIKKQSGNDVLLKYYRVIKSKLEDYLNLIEILNNANNRPISELSEYLGYSVPEVSMNVFSNLCQKLKIGSSIVINEHSTNDALINYCQNEASKLEEYIKLMDILNNANGRPSSELSEYLGYSVPKESMIEFHNLCQKLKIKPSAELIREETKKDLRSFLEGNSLQFQRVQNYILRHHGFQIEKVPLATDEIDNRPRDFMEIISLGVNGLLTKEMVVALKETLSTNRYEKLLESLQATGIFSSKEISEIRSLASPGYSENINLDELVIFLATRQDLDVNNLRILISGIGFYNYHYVIDELFKMGVISVDIYLKIVKDYLNNEKTAAFGLEKYTNVVEQYYGKGQKK